MNFALKLGLDKLPENADIIERRAVKGIVLRRNQILLIKTNKGDYKIPGGGIKKGETIQDCLKREFREETGYALIDIGEMLGTVQEQNPDKFNPKKYFRMSSEYYLCGIDCGSRVELKLDDYEAEQNFMPEFVDIYEALNTNQNLLKNEQLEAVNSWIEREVAVLNEIVRIIEKNE